MVFFTKNIWKILEILQQTFVGCDYANNLADYEI
nr:MAG TPA: hypothetical protein [Caudoviricetes sp.]